ncbi:hypothetical protein COOONC_25118 [Cooperia oncophora]
MLIYMAIVVGVMAVVEAPPPKTNTGITPIPFDKINPRANEFRRLEPTERADQRDGVVSRGEYDTYYKRMDDERRRNDMERERFFEGLVGFHRDPALQFFSAGASGKKLTKSVSEERAPAHLA